MTINEVIDDLRRIAAEDAKSWYPGKEKTRAEIIVSYIEYLEKRNAQLNADVSKLLWKDTKWGA